MTAQKATMIARRVHIAAGFSGDNSGVAGAFTSGALSDSMFRWSGVVFVVGCTACSRRVEFPLGENSEMMGLTFHVLSHPLLPFSFVSYAPALYTLLGARGKRVRHTAGSRLYVMLVHVPNRRHCPGLR